MFGLFKKKPTAVEQPSDTSLIVPRIKNINFLSFVRERIKNEDQLPVTEPLVADLLVTYAFDLPQTFQMVRKMDVTKLGLSAEQLRAIAVANLKRQVGDFGYQGEPPLVQAVTGNDLEACVLLLDDFWQMLAGKLPPEIVVGAPTRDVLLITTTASGNEGLQMLRDAIRKARSGENTHWLTEQLLVRRSDHWEVFDGAGS